MVAGCKALADLHGLNDDNATPASGMTLEEVGREVRVVSPLLLDKIAKVEEIRLQRIGERAVHRALLDGE